MRFTSQFRLVALLITGPWGGREYLQGRTVQETTGLGAASLWQMAGIVLAAPGSGWILASVLVLLAGLAGLWALWRSLRAAQNAHVRRRNEMMDRFPGVVCLLAPDGRFLLANRRLEEYTLQAPGALVGRRPREVMSPENAERFERNLAHSLAKGEVMEYQEDYLLPAGKVVFDIRAFPLHGPKGEIESICVFAADVTDRWLLEQDRAQCAARYEAFVRLSTEAIFRIEYEPPVPVDWPVREFADACYARGFIQEANETAAAAFGLPLDRLIGSRYGELVDRRRPQNRETDRRWYENGFQLTDFIISVMDADGTERILRANTVGVVENGRLLRTWNSTRDITEQRRLENENARAVERYESFVRQSTEAIWRIEYEPPVPVDLPTRRFAQACYARGVVREGNTVAAAFLGAAPETLIGRRYRDMVDRRIPEVREADRRWYENGFRLADFEHVTVSPTGERRVFLTNTVGIVENGCMARTWLTQREVTDERRLQEMVANTARGVSAETGTRFFDSLVEHLAKSLGASRAVACEVVPGTNRGRVLAAWAGHALAAGREHEITVGPGAEAVRSGKVAVWRAPSPLPETDLPDVAGWMGQACVAMPLLAEKGVTGFVAVSWAYEPELASPIQSVLEIFAARAAAELERLRAERRVLSYQSQLKALAARNQRLAEEERSHLAREIHDELGQSLTALKIGLSNIRQRIQKSQHELALEDASELMALADQTVGTVRRLATGLRPPALDQLGLAAAIRWQAKDLHSRMGIRVECDLAEAQVDEAVGITAFRIFQESLTNIMRHAEAKNVRVRLQLQEDGISLTVKDDGVGFIPAPGENGSLGLLGMHERAMAVGGRLTIQSQPGEGTTVEARLPLREGAYDARVSRGRSPDS